MLKIMFPTLQLCYFQTTSYRLTTLKGKKKDKHHLFLKNCFPVVSLLQRVKFVSVNLGVTICTTGMC